MRRGRCSGACAGGSAQRLERGRASSSPSSPSMKQKRQSSAAPPPTVREPPKRLRGTGTRSSTISSEVAPSGSRNTRRLIVSPGLTRRRARSRKPGWSELADSTLTISAVRCSWVIVDSACTLVNDTGPNGLSWISKRNANNSTMLSKDTSNSEKCMFGRTTRTTPVRPDALEDESEAHGPVAEAIEHRVLVPEEVERRDVREPEEGVGRLPEHRRLALPDRNDIRVDDDTRDRDGVRLHPFEAADPCEAILIDDAVQVGQVGDLEPTEEVAGIRDHLEHVGSVHGHGIGTRPSVPEERMAEREQEVVAHHGRRSHTRDREISDADRAGDRVTGGEDPRRARRDSRLRNGTG